MQTIIHENIHATNLSPAGGIWYLHDFSHPDADPMTGNRPAGINPISDVEVQKAMGIPSYTARGSRNIDDKLKKEGCK